MTASEWRDWCFGHPFTHGAMQRKLDECIADLAAVEAEFAAYKADCCATHEADNERCVEVEKERDEHMGTAIACEARAVKAEKERDDAKGRLRYMVERCTDAEARAEKAERERGEAWGCSDEWRRRCEKALCRVKALEECYANAWEKMKEAQARVRVLEEAWERYGNHDDDCDVCHPVHSDRCSCGFDERCAALAGKEDGDE